MSVTFTKLFSSITESTVWQEDNETRLVWIAMLAMADRKGRVWGSVPGLAHRARVSVEGAQKALGVFMAPDPFSRTKDHEGRRIGEIDGGWILLNHAKYRAIRDDEETKESKRVWAANNRKKVEKVDQSRTPSNEVGTNRCNAESDSEADAEAKSETIHKQTKRPDGLKDEELERALRLGRLFGRRPDTAWSKKEVDRFRVFITHMAPEDLDLLVWYYEQPGVEFRRKDLGTLLNNIPGELDRALAHKNRPPSLLDGLNGANIANVASGALKPNSVRSASMDAVVWKDELEEVSQKLATIRNTYEGLQTWSESDKEKYNVLLARKRELKAKLGIQV